MDQEALPSWVTSLNVDSAAESTAEAGEVLSTGTFYDGPFTARLEHLLALDFGCHAVGVGSGMDALELILEAAGVAGRKVLLPANCFPAIPALVLRLGGRPVPVGVDMVHLAPRLDQVDVSDRPLVVWVHHLGMISGQAQQKIAELRSAGCFVVEDCAYVSFGAGDRVGTWGDASVLTFGPTKPAAGAGGGVVLTTHDDLAATVAARRRHSGQERRWEAGDELLRYRSISEFEAVVAYHQWQSRNERRTALVALTSAYLARLGDGWLPAGRTPQPTWGRFPVDVGEQCAGQVQRSLWNEYRIRTTQMYERPWFDYPSLQDGAAQDPADPAWARLRSLLRRTVCVPFHPAMTEADVARVTAALTGARASSTRAS